MDTLSYIFDYFKLNQNETSYPIALPNSRWDMGELLNSLGHKKGVEVGIYKGAFTASIARKAPNTQIFGVDAWRVYPGYKDNEENDLESKAEAEAIRRTREFPNIKLIKSWSLDAAKQFADESLDFVFIDANHDYEHCKEDIEVWNAKVRSGGLVMGHDYVVKKGVGVIQAVDEWVKKNSISPLFTWTDRTPSWMYVKDKNIL
jgi:predicted O-methyltransferase YrrM